MKGIKSEIVAIYIITIIGVTSFYQAIKGSLIFDSITEFIYVLLGSILIATIISLMYFKFKKRKKA
jgi:hypothetical protein